MRHEIIFRTKFITAIFAACFFVALCLPAFADGGGNEEGTDTTAKVASVTPEVFSVQPDANVQPNEKMVRAGLLYDMDQKKIVWEKKMDVAFPMASLTKMMVALLTVEDIRSGKISWTDKVNVTKLQVAYVKGRRRTVTIREEYSLEDLFKAAMIASDNAASEAIAAYINGSVGSFVARMNTRAKELGMNSTFYSNPTGLPAYRASLTNSSSPTDLLRLALEMMQYDEIIGTTSQGFADISNGKRTSTLRNHNRLVIDFENEVDGLKTGYTRRAGFCLVATARKCEHRLIAIALGSNSPTLRNDFVRKMFDGYYSSIGLEKLGNQQENKTVTASAAAPAAKKKSSYYERTKNYLYHVVKPGDTLITIAQLYPGVSVKELLRFNRISHKKILRRGSKLRIPLKA
ncbi:MAG TPA: serine hydrolase [Bacteroidia bacterium]|nr:serine hydrolase [Bacteroidia bacterium]